MGAKYTVVSLLLVVTLYSAAKPSLGAALSRNRAARYVRCRENVEFLHESHCCLNCPAGQFVQQPCTQPLTQGTCADCPYDTYTEHKNGLRQCLPCAKCRADEVLTRQCNTTHNSQCQCKSGSFCPPEQACELCKKCSRCKPDEQEVKMCTAISNTVCKKKASASIAVPVTVTVVVLVIALIFLPFCLWKKRRWKHFPVNLRKSAKTVKMNTDDETITTVGEGGGQSAVRVEPQQEKEPFLKESPLVGAKDDGLGNSLPSTTRSSQTSLSSQHTAPWCSRYSHPSPVALRPPATRADTPRRRLIPLNGQESLKKSFSLFEEMDMRFHNKFFRRIGLNDNVILSADSQSHADKVYDLLRIWLEKQGTKADINDLIEALLYLDQKLSAENIIERGIKNGDFAYEELNSPINSPGD